MNKKEKELLAIATDRKKTLTGDKFKSWLRGFRQPAPESEALKKAFNSLLEVVTDERKTRDTG